VDSLVRAGQYAGFSEVIQEALRQHRVNKPSFSVVMTPELKTLLDEGMEDLDQALTTEQLRQRG
jgi:Arc/MetJ-type ribon-helix-helix transcriptional regulator